MWVLNAERVEGGVPEAAALFPHPHTPFSLSLLFGILSPECGKHLQCSGEEMLSHQEQALTALARHCVKPPLV